jgi:chemotaxis protein MotB
MLRQPPSPMGKLPPVRLVSTGLPRPLPRGHRGGAWKVAYADFVTALMALFIVLWMMHASARVKQSVSSYFHDPRGFASQQAARSANAAEGTKQQPQNIQDVQQQLEAALRRSPEFDQIRKHVQFSLTVEGLRIDLTETEHGMFFVSGNAAPTEAGEHLLKLLGAEIAALPNTVVIEGYTDARPYRAADATTGYTNWELSTDRANAARRLLCLAGARARQVVEVRGYADEKLLNASEPNDAKNRRVSLVVKFMEQKGGKTETRKQEPE